MILQLSFEGLHGRNNPVLWMIIEKVMNILSLGICEHSQSITIHCLKGVLNHRISLLIDNNEYSTTQSTYEK